MEKDRQPTKPNTKVQSTISTWPDVWSWLQGFRWWSGHWLISAVASHATSSGRPQQPGGSSTALDVSEWERNHRHHEAVLVEVGRLEVGGCWLGENALFTRIMGKLWTCRARAACEGKMEEIWPPDVEEHTFTLQVTNQAECLTVGVVIKSLVATISWGKRRAALILLGNWDDQFEEIVLMGICTLFLESVLSGPWEVVSQLVSKQLARTLASHSETRFA